MRLREELEEGGGEDGDESWNADNDAGTLQDDDDDDDDDDGNEERCCYCC